MNQTKPLVITPERQKELLEKFPWLAEKRAEMMRNIAAIMQGRPKPPPAEVVEFPPKLSEAELWRRQLAIDACWERTLAAKRELEERYGRTCHRGPGDPDWQR
jgi:hypothetical protein